MEKKSNLKKKIVALGIIGFCIIAYFMVILPYLNRGEGDPYFLFTEVPVKMTVNSSIIHLEDKVIFNVRGIDVEQETGKISRIYIRNSQNPEITPYEFNQRYGSSMSDPSSRKYLEYNGVYYYAIEYIP
jgi:hypothetical protein